MLLIFGLSVFFRTVGVGVFHCPGCGGDRDFRRRVARRWFTLFFVPVIPLNRVGEVIECTTCKNRYGLQVLRLPTAQQMAEALPAAMRASAAVILHAGEPGNTAARTRAIEAVRGYGDEAYGEDDLNTDLARPLDGFAEVIGQAGTQLTVEGREWFLAQAVRIALAEGQLTDQRRQVLRGVAEGLGMTPAHAHGVIATTEGAASP